MSPERAVLLALALALTLCAQSVVVRAAPPPKTFRDFFDGGWFALVGERRITGDDEHLFSLREGCDNRVYDTVSQILLFRIATQILKRHDGD